MIRRCRFCLLAFVIVLWACQEIPYIDQSVATSTTSKTFAPTPVVMEPTKTTNSHNFPLQLIWTQTLKASILFPPQIISQVVVLRPAESLTWPNDLSNNVLQSFIGLDAQTGAKLWGAEGYFHYHDRNNWGSINEHLILMGQKQIEAINVHTGQTTWTSEVYSDSLSTMTYNANTVFLLSNENKLVAFNGMSGQKQWQIIVPVGAEQLIYDAQNQRILVPGLISLQGSGRQRSYEFHLQVVDANDGNLIEVLALDEEFSKFCKSDRLQFYEGQLYCPGLVYNLLTKAKIYLETETLVATSLPPISNGTVYIRTQRGSIKAIDLDTGKDVWEYIPFSNPSSTTIITNITVVGNYGYAIADDATIRAINLENGQEIGYWQATLNPELRYKSQIDGPIAGIGTDGVRIFVSLGTETLYAFGP